jgi:hypothetical protein
LVAADNDVIEGALKLNPRLTCHLANLCQAFTISQYSGLTLISYCYLPGELLLGEAHPFSEALHERSKLSGFHLADLPRPEWPPLAFEPL